MTPSINRIAYSAQVLGEYLLEQEFKVVREQFDQDYITTFPQFCRWVTGYTYYHALVCATGGNEQNINNALSQAYDELLATAGPMRKLAQEAA